MPDFRKAMDNLFQSSLAHLFVLTCSLDMFLLVCLFVWFIVGFYLSWGISFRFSVVFVENALQIKSYLCGQMYHIVVYPF